MRCISARLKRKQLRRCCRTLQPPNCSASSRIHPQTSKTKQGWATLLYTNCMFKQLSYSSSYTIISRLWPTAQSKLSLKLIKRLLLDHVPSHNPNITYLNDYFTTMVDLPAQTFPSSYFFESMLLCTVQAFLN